MKAYRTSGFRAWECTASYPNIPEAFPTRSRPSSSSGSGLRSGWGAGIDRHGAPSHSPRMPSQHTRLRALVRGELRSLLADLLAALPPAGPVARPSTPPAGSDALAAALAAWVALGGGGRGCTAGEAVALVPVRHDAWMAFLGGVESLLGADTAHRLRALAAVGGADRAAAHALGQVLRQMRGRMVGERVLVGELSRTTKVVRWRVAGAASPAPDLAPGHPFA